MLTSGMGDGVAKESKSLASQNTGLVTSLLMSDYSSTNVSRIPIGCGPCSHELPHLTQFSTPVVPNIFGTRDLFFQNFSTDRVEGGSGSNASDEAHRGAAAEASRPGPATYLLLYGLIPNRPRTSACPQLQGWGCLLYAVSVKSGT